MTSLSCSGIGISFCCSFFSHSLMYSNRHSYSLLVTSDDTSKSAFIKKKYEKKKKKKKLPC